MPVTARSVKPLTRSANTAATDTGTRPVRAGTYSREVGDEVVTGWHSHDFHQLEYAFEGVAEVETRNAKYLLPPQQAIWIPAGAYHCSTLTEVKAVSVFFDPSMGLPSDDRVRVLAAAPVIREMMLYARRWPISRSESDHQADTFFEALASLVVEWLDHETPLCLPTAEDPLTAAAMQYTSEHLEDVTLTDVCNSVGASERTMRRSFLAATGMSWRDYRQQSRLLKAMAMLASTDQSLLSISVAVGFESASAFTRAFVRYTGESPKSYRHRTRSARFELLPMPGPMNEETSERMERAVEAWSHFPPDR